MDDVTAVEDPKDAEIAELRRQLQSAVMDRAVDAEAVADPGAPVREDRAPVPSVDDMARDMKPAALERSAQAPPSALQKSMRQMEWAGELATGGPPRMPGDDAMGDRVTALETGLTKLAQAVADMPGQVVGQIQELLRKQSAAS